MEELRVAVLELLLEELRLTELELEPELRELEVEPDPRTVVEVEPEGDTVVVRVSAEPEFATRLLTVVLEELPVDELREELEELLEALRAVLLGAAELRETLEPELEALRDVPVVLPVLVALVLPVLLEVEVAVPALRLLVA